jgi:hypothetical protein
MFQRPDQVHSVTNAVAVHRAVGVDRPDAKSGRYRTHVQYEQARETLSRALTMQSNGLIPNLKAPVFVMFAALVSAFANATNGICCKFRIC